MKGTESEFFEEDLEEASISVANPSHSYRLFEHRAVALRLRNAKVTGELGSRELSPADYSNTLAILSTLPYRILFFQLVWSTAVTLCVYGLAPKNLSWFSVEFWVSRLGVSSSISYALGWALFVLLGFFIRDASERYWEAQLNWTQMAGNLRQIVRQLRQNYPAGTWHDGDIDRIAAHLVAYPITLKMVLRDEHDEEQLRGILHQHDIDDVLSADEMHTQCMRVVRAYFSASEDDAPRAFRCSAAGKTPAGWGMRYLIMEILDTVDRFADEVLATARSSTSVGYTTHLHIFFYLWMFFLPLSLVQSSGWFTILWAVLTSYGVGMLFTIGKALNDPFGCDIQDIKLNHLAADTALQVFDAFARDRLELGNAVKKTQDTPRWLEDPREEGSPETSATSSILSRFVKLRIGTISKDILLYLVAIAVWTSFILYLTLVVGDDDRTECRWWCIYLPVDSSITSYVSLGVFLVLGFWLNVAYRRYWRALHLWKNKIRTNIEELAFQFAITCKPGTWHHRDRERLLSHVVAISYATKFELRGSRDTSELYEFLSPQDVAAFDESEDFFLHATDVVFAYLNSIDSVSQETVQVSKHPLNSSTYSFGHTLWGLEKTIQECVAIQKYPIPPSFTIHLKMFTVLWLALLPLSVIRISGFLSFLYVIPISYSVINIISIGSNLTDPFGFEKEDVPLDTLCEEIKASVHHVYHATLEGFEGFVTSSNYSRESLMAKLTRVPAQADANDSRSKLPPFKQLHDEPTSDGQPTATTTVKRLEIGFKKLPFPSIRGMFFILAWCTTAVFLSYGFSFTWSEEKRGSCVAWCSPIDVEANVLANVGFLIFLMLGFQASGAIERHEEAVSLMFGVAVNLRSLAIEFAQSFDDGFFHEQDKERIVAHLARIPLCLLDRLIGVESTGTEEKEEPLSTEDRTVFESNAYPIEHLLQTAEAYILLHDSSTREGYRELSSYRVFGTLTVTMLRRIAEVRESVSRAFTVKRSSVISSYSHHQHLFTVLWITLLPFAMTPKTGFYTILWASLTSIGVLGLEEHVSKPVQPCGTGDTDIPLEKMCKEAAASILEGVGSVDWGMSRKTEQRAADEARFDALPLKKNSSHHYSVNLLEDTEHPFFREDIVEQCGRASDPKRDISLYSYLRCFLPTWSLMFVIIWSAAATVISYFARDKTATARWWQSNITVDSTVVTYISFAAFVLLAFVTQSALARYKSVRAVWARLRSSCHALTVQIHTCFPEGAIHDLDRRRIMAHLVAFPLLLKGELLGSLDVAEFKGLLSDEDVCRIQGSNSPVNYCVDEIRSYVLGVTVCSEQLRKPFHGGNRLAFVNYEIIELEKAIWRFKCLRSVENAPGFLALLKAFLLVWILVLPFELAEHSGWLTIFWMPVIVYGVLGMYTTADELRYSFSSDGIELDLDAMAGMVVSEVLLALRHFETCANKFVHPSSARPFWKERDSLSQESWNKNRLSMLHRFFRLGWHTFSAVHATAIAIWTTLCVVGSWFVSKKFPFDDEIEAQCRPWFCSRISISSIVNEYTAFGLFLLMGFRLYESHNRYASGMSMWRQILGTTRLLSNRIFQCYYGGDWHDEDLERIGAHLSAFSVVVMDRLRKEESLEQLKRLLSEEDTEELLNARDRASYCLDVLHYYFSKWNRWSAYKEEPHAGRNEHRVLLSYLRNLKRDSDDLEQITNSPMPFGYVLRLRIFLVIWMLMLPFGLVESTGWLTILWIELVLYAIAGIEKWSTELSNPFGKDMWDVPLGEFVDNAARAVRTNLTLFEDGVRPFIRSDRLPFTQLGAVFVTN